MPPTRRITGRVHSRRFTTPTVANEGVAATGLTGAALVGLARLSTSHIVTGYAVAGGLALAVCGYLPAVLLVSAPLASAVVRLRRALDGLSVGVCLLFTFWLLLIAPHRSI